MIAKRYILEEVAAELRVKKRWLTDFLRAHPRDEYGEPFFRLAGRVKLFTESDVSRVYKALPCPSSSSNPAKAKARTTRSGDPTLASLLTRAAALTNDPSLAPSSQGSNKPSNPENTPRGKLRLVANEHS